MSMRMLLLVHKVLRVAHLARQRFDRRVPRMVVQGDAAGEGGGRFKRHLRRQRWGTEDEMHQDALLALEGRGRLVGGLWGRRG